jgi:Cu(I)/Ag(I) efflux system membrane fusion protein
MNKTVKNIGLVLCSAIGGAAIFGYAIPYLPSALGFSNSAEQQPQGASSSEPVPLYWVAPMDANYRRDKPGQSPMGMDLVPFYESADQSSPGTITVSPEVVNNLSVRLDPVIFQPMQLAVNTVGYVQYNQDTMVHVHPRVEGWLEKIYVKSVGEPVLKGQPLYDLYSPELVNAQEEFLFALKRGDSRLIKAGQRRLRALQLPAGAIERLRRDRTVKQTVTFYAPSSGVVENFAMQAGFFVKPGKMLMSIASLDEVWLEAQVFERQTSLIKQGAQVQIKLDALPQREWTGKVDYIYPTLDKMSRALRVRVRLANVDKVLRPNMYAQVRISVPDDKPVLSVPREALIRIGTQDRVVLSLGKGRFKSIAVVAGRSDGKRIEIISGVKERELVATSAQFLLDSESSKTSDFKRIDVQDPKSQSQPQPQAQQMAAEETAQPDSVWVSAKVEQQMAESRQVKLTHEPIAQWQWPAMSMNFNLSDTLKLTQLAVGTELAVKLGRDDDNNYSVLEVAPSAQLEQLSNKEKLTNKMQESQP